MVEEYENESMFSIPAFSNRIKVYQMVRNSALNTTVKAASIQINEHSIPTVRFRMLVSEYQNRRN